MSLLERQVNYSEHNTVDLEKNDITLNGKGIQLVGTAMEGRAVAAPISMDLRERAMERLDRGQTVGELAGRRVGVDCRTFWNAVHRAVYSLKNRLSPNEQLRAVNAGAHLLFLPPCSLDLNLIEQVFAKPEHLLRSVVERTAEANWRCIGDQLDRFPPEYCANHFTNLGYAPT